MQEIDRLGRGLPAVSGVVFAHLVLTSRAVISRARTSVAGIIGITAHARNTGDGLDCNALHAIGKS